MAPSTAFALAVLALGLGTACLAVAVVLAARLKRSESLNRALFDLSHAGLVVIDAQGRIERANDAFAALAGRGASGLIHANINLILPLPGDGDLLHAEVKANRPDEAEVWAYVSSRTLPGDAPPRRVIVAVDTTPIRTADRILARYDNELKQRNEELAKAAAHDRLTGLPNRGLLLDRLGQAVTAIQDMESGGLALLFIDLDGFKPINDTHGHDVGDVVLKQVSARMREALRGSDTLARFGGDEFVVLAVGITDPGPARIIGEKLLEAVSLPIRHDGRELRVGASIGIALFPGCADDADGLLRAADEAMYEAKSAGRHRFVFHPSTRNRHPNAFD